MMSPKVGNNLALLKKLISFVDKSKAIIMSTQTMAQVIADYFKQQPVVKAWLFGSYSRGEERPDSDVDILITLDKKANVGLFKLSGMSLDLQDLLNKRVDLVTDKGLLPFARETADRDKILIYERAN